jgi:hypothetical protein
MPGGIVEAARLAPGLLQRIGLRKGARWQR